ncbi:hypothetical protein WAI453_009746 [Rhynchosporium graminicola]|uniref:Uncharacterized protein n=1 Tax=Rhynchosporium graminicola TaxID=2792576 RepID=A0A1E1KDI3_9HELO|nr:uncharacterized protein RCO7_05056 [Rhynchosporium commune]
MPSETYASQSQTRPSIGQHRSTNSIHSEQTNSLSTTPPQYGKPKKHGHVVGGGGRGHARVPSSKALHKLTKAAHANDAGGSHTDLKKLARNTSSKDLKKNSSHVSLKRNRSAADVQKRTKAAQEQEDKRRSVNFEIGDTEDAWENDSSASPALSRSASRPASGNSSSKPSAPNSQSHSPPQSPSSTARSNAATNGSEEKQTSRQTADAKVITERLLQRTQSHNTTKMSLATATPSAYVPDSPEKSQNGTPTVGSGGNEVVSRFVGGSCTPSENSPFLNNHKNDGRSKQTSEDMKRAQSMGNLARPDQERDDDEESVLAPRSRKSSTGHAYVPPQQSRTQQKLWLQRASSNIEPQQMAPGVAMNGLAGLHGNLGGTSLVGAAGYDGRDPRIKLQLERTGLEYLVVRRHQDPIGQAIKRLSLLPGAEKNRRIPAHKAKSVNGEQSMNAGHYGLSQSLKESRSRAKKGSNKQNAGSSANGANSSYEGHSGSLDEGDMSDRGGDNNDTGALLRSMWDKSYDYSASAD